MANKKNITDEEKKQFREAMSTPGPLPAQPYSTDNQSHKRTSPSRNAATPPLHASEIESALNQHWRDFPEQVHIQRHGMDNRTFAKLRAGQWRPTATLDLHGLHVDQAIQAVDHCLATLPREEQDVLLIITGKGNHSASGKGIIKQAVANWLNQHERVLAVSSASQRDGGTGALYVLTKKERL